MFGHIFKKQENQPSATAGSSSEDKVFVLGLDGAILDFINRPELPNFKKILSEGSSGKLFSRPALTPAAWTSMTTGQNPGKHGIFDFRVGERLLFSTDKKSKQLWDYVPSVVINVPMTFPVKPIDGVMISGMMSPDLDSELVYPESERQYLKDIDYIIEADQDLADIKKSIEIRIEMVKRYYEYDWRLFFVVFREYDVIHHFFWGQEFEYYKMMDDFLGEFLLPRLEADGVKLAIVSDHGFAPVDKAVDIDQVLLELGYDDCYTVGGWGALYKTQSPRFKDPSFRNEIVEKLRGYQHEGKSILDVFLNEEIYWGDEASAGPDLLVWPKRELGYTFAMRADSAVIPSLHKNGCHLEHGMVVLHGFDTQQKELDANIKDIFPTVLKGLGVDAPADIDGKLII